MWRSLLAYASICVVVGSSHASFEGILQVAQPLQVWSGESGVRVAMIPYVGHSVGPEDRGKVFLLTVTDNLVWCDGKAQNRNLASQVGIQFLRAWATGPDRGAATAFLSDTLQVDLRVPDAPKPPNVTIDDVVAATMWCGLLNASQLWPSIRYVEYRIADDSQFAEFAGVYSVKGIEWSGVFLWSPDTKQALFDRRDIKR